MGPRLLLRQTVRNARGAGGRMAFFLLCLSVGVAAVVAVASLSQGVDGIIQGEARELLAADLVIEGRQRLPEEIEEFLQGQEGVRSTQLREMVTVVSRPGDGEGSPGQSQLVELKVTGAGYPFYGELALTAAGEETSDLGSLLGPDGVVVAPELLTRLGLQPGEVLRVGGESFRIRGTVLDEPDRVSFSLTLGPRIFLSPEGFERTKLEQFGSRIEYKTLLQVADSPRGERLPALVERIEELLPTTGRWNVESYREAQPALRQGLARVERFLGLVALLSLILGGIGVAQTVRAWIAGELDDIAILKSLGFRPREVLFLYLGQACLLGLVGSAAGVLLGLALPLLAPVLLGELLPEGAIRFWQPWAMLRGLGLGTGVALLFSLPPLSRLHRVPPVRVLRRDAAPVPLSRWMAVSLLLLLLTGVAVAATLQSGSLALGLQFTAGGAIAAAALAVLAWLGVRLAARFPRSRAAFPLRHGIAALGRPGAGVVGAVVALGLGIAVVLAMFVVQDHLTEQLDRNLPAQAPSLFLVDIQPDQWAGVQEELAKAEAQRVESVPVIMARLVAMDGEDIASLTADNEADRRRRWALTREQRLTYLEEFGEDNRLVAGEPWQADDRAELSIEEEFARRIGASVGSRLTFNIQGVPVEMVVTSLRSVRWESFRINFFFVVEPGVLEEAPQFRIATAQLPPDQEQRLQDRLASHFPNVTVLRIREILAKIVAVLDRLGLAVRLLGSLTVLTGLAILAGAVSASATRRGKEVALLKTVGMTRLGVTLTFAVEYALVGLLAGTLGAVAGVVLARVVVTEGLELAWTTPWTATLGAVGVGVALTLAAGLASSTGALQKRPVEVLRGES